MYNGVELPALPEYDTEHYEAAIFDLMGEGKAYFLDLQEKGYGYKVVDDCWELSVNENGETYAPLLYAKGATDTEWFMWGGADLVYGHLYQEYMEDMPMVWTNSAVPVMNMDTGEVLMTASEPVPVPEEPDAPDEPDAPSMWIYNGVELPALPEWDKETYPYAVLRYSMRWRLSCYTSKPYVTLREGYGEDDSHRALRYNGVSICHNLYDGVWEGEEDVRDYGADAFLIERGIWTNFDLYHEDGSLYCAASEPISADQPKYSPTLTSRTHSFTDTTVITEVTLMGLDPSKVYKVYWSIYDTDDNLLGHGVSEQIGEITGVETATGFSRIVNLQPGTTYSLYWHLAENESVLDTTFSNTVTTLGLAPGGSDTPGGSGDTGSDFTGGEGDITGSQGDGNTGILMQILNKLSAIFDFLTGDKEVEDTPEQALKDATSEVTQTVTDTFFGGDAAGQTVTSGNVGDLANTQGTIKQLFASDYTFGDFLAIFSGDSYYGFFSPEVAMDLNPLAYGSPAVVDMDDLYNQSAYFENLEKVRGKHG